MVQDTKGALTLGHPYRAQARLRHSEGKGNAVNGGMKTKLGTDQVRVAVTMVIQQNTGSPGFLLNIPHKDTNAAS